MDFILTEDQQEIREMARKFARQVIEPRAAEIDEKAVFDRDVHKKMAELGLIGMTVPEEMGGLGTDTLTWCIAIEEIAKASTAVSNYLTLQESMLNYLSHLGTPEQVEKYIPEIISGDLICSFAMTEPNAGSDAGSVKTTAILDGDSYVLNGQKMFITLALQAGLFVVVANTDPSIGKEGIRTFLVPRDTPGLSLGQKLDLMGVRGTEVSPVFFDDCRIPRENLLGTAEGFANVMAGMDGPGRLGAASQALGLAEAAYEAAMAYSQQRTQFGREIFKFQDIKFILADMATDIEAARNLIYKAAWRRDHGLPYTKETSMAKLFAGRMCVRQVTNAMQIFGGYSYSKEYPVERYFRDCKIHQIWDGTDQVQKIIIAKELLKEFNKK